MIKDLNRIIDLHSFDCGRVNVNLLGKRLIKKGKGRLMLSMF